MSLWFYNNCYHCHTRIITFCTYTYWPVHQPILANYILLAIILISVTTFIHVGAKLCVNQNGWRKASTSMFLKVSQSRGVPVTCSLDLCFCCHYYFFITLCCSSFHEPLVHWLVPSRHLTDSRLQLAFPSLLRSPPD